MNMLYAIITNECDLQCPHCVYSKESDCYNEEALIDQVNKVNGSVIVMGGEPTLHMDRLNKVLSTGKVTSITTNLLYLDDELIDIYKNISLGTSWNKKRFTYVQYQTWLSNIKRLEENNITVGILITLDKDLITSSVNVFMDMLKSWKSYNNIMEIKLEQLIDESTDDNYFEQVDDWLCELYKIYDWDIKFTNHLFNNLKYNKWSFGCDEVFTVFPNGTLRRGCAHEKRFKRNIRNECLACEYASICQPCKLQRQCTFPKKLYKLIHNIEE